jgi:hypothetical protein
MITFSHQTPERTLLQLVKPGTADSTLAGTHHTRSGSPEDIQASALPKAAWCLATSSCPLWDYVTMGVYFDLRY